MGMFLGTLLLSLIAWGAEDAGQLQVLLFLDDVPQPQRQIIIGQHPYSTSNHGAVNLSLPVGEHQLQINGFGPQAQVLKFVIGKNQTTEILASFYTSTVPTQVLIDGPEGGTFSSASDKNPVDQKQQRITGTISDQKNQRPIGNVRIFIRGEQLNERGNHLGEFSLALPPGEYDVSFIHPKYITRQVKVQVGGQIPLLPLKVQMVPTGIELEELVVLAPHLKGSVAAVIEIRRSNEAVAEVIGAEQIARSADSDAAASLKRVTGLTVMDGKYVYVRGLGERYSSSTFNGSVLPGPEPNRRVIPLDMFPTGIIQNMVIQKSYTPDLPGEFGGGNVAITTKSFPEQLYLKNTISGRYQPGSDQVLSAQGGKWDFFGTDDGGRSLPGIVAQASSGNNKIKEQTDAYPGGFSAAELTTLGQAFPNRLNVSRDSKQLPPGISLEYGNSYGKTHRLGFFLTGMYGNELDHREKTKAKYNYEGQGNYSLDTEYQYLTTEEDYKLGGLLAGGYQWQERMKIHLSSMVFRKTTNKTQEVQGFYSNDNQTIRTTNLQWVERQLLIHQARGEYVFPFLRSLELSWRATHSQAYCDEPDNRSYRYRLRSDQSWELTPGKGSNERLYGTLMEESNSYGIDLVQKIPWWGAVPGKIKVGIQQDVKERSGQIRRYIFAFKGDAAAVPDLFTQSPERVFARENIGPGLFQLQENTQDTDNYLASQSTGARFAMVDLPLGPQVKLVAGIRWEHSIQHVKTYKLFDPDNAPAVAQLEMIDRLPAYNITYEPWRGIIFRGSFSETISRPDFKELSTAPYYDDQLGAMVVGNNQLIGTVIKNYDLRAEWYPSHYESVSFAWFRKDFSHPIEITYAPGTEEKITLENALGARNDGQEIEIRKNLGNLSRGMLSAFTLGANYSRIFSVVQLDPAGRGVQTSSARPLQGQSPWILNFQLEYDREKWGTKATVLFNIYGERSVEVGRNSIPDTKELPAPKLDLVLNQKISKRSSCKFTATNLLNPLAQLRQGAMIVESYQKGRAFAFAWTFTI